MAKPEGGGPSERLHAPGQTITGPSEQNTSDKQHLRWWWGGGRTASNRWGNWVPAANAKEHHPGSHSLVGFGFVQPNAADERPHHAGDDDGQADPPSIHLFTLRNQQRRGIQVSRVSSQRPPREGGGSLTVTGDDLRGSAR